MKTRRNDLNTELRYAVVAVALSVIVGAILLMIAATLLVNGVVSQSVMGYAAISAILICILTECIAIREPAGWKRLLVCVCCSCGYYSILLILSCALDGSFSAGTSRLWMLTIATGLVAGLCGKRQKNATMMQLRLRKIGPKA